MMKSSLVQLQKDSKSSASKLPAVSRLTEASGGRTGLTSWPESFPKIRPLFRPVQPATNEPVILRFNSKALFERECENLTFGAYEQYQPAHSQQSGQKTRKSQPLRRRPSAKGVGGESTAQAAVSHERTVREQNMQQAREKLFLRFPVAHAVFARRNKPITILRQSEDCAY